MKFKTPPEAIKSANKIFSIYLDYRDAGDFIGMDMCRKFLEMGFTRSRRYANHKDGKKYDENGNVRPQENTGGQMKPRNFVQKWMKRFCKSTVEVDRKKREKRGYTKHKKSEIKLDK